MTSTSDTVPVARFQTIIRWSNTKSPRWVELAQAMNMPFGEITGVPPLNCSDSNGAADTVPGMARVIGPNQPVMSRMRWAELVATT